MKRSIVADRQRGRAQYLRQLDEAASREKAERREQLQRRLERRALEHQVLVEAIELEKELEARRCQLCDLLRAEAWGLGHANWTERKCGRCFAQQADALARQRHSLALARGQASIAGRPPPARPPSAAALAAAGGAWRWGMEAAAAAAAPASGRGDARQLSPSRLFGDVPPERVDAVIEALRARDAGRLMQLLDESARARHLGPPQPTTAPPPEQPYGDLYYHDVVLSQMDAGGQPTAGGSGPPPSESGSIDDGELATSSVVADAGGGSRRPRDSGRQQAGRIMAARTGQSGSGPETSDGGEEDLVQSAPPARRAGSRPGAVTFNLDQPREGAAGASVGQPRPSVTEPGRSSDAATELSFRPGPREEGEEPEEATTAAATRAAGQAPKRPGEQRRAGGSGAWPGSAEQGWGQGRAVRVGEYRPEARPLPSKPRRVPEEEAELEEALREAEQMVVFGSTQRLRSEALFYSHQLRAALADLRLLRRKAARAEAVHRHGVRLEPRDGEGVKRIIREGRPDQAPSPTVLRRFADPDSPYVDPPRRAPAWLDHVHPDRPDPTRVVDPVAWRPPSARVPPPRHTPGLQAAGDWSEYRYEWELAAMRSLPAVEDYREVVRGERGRRSAWAERQARAHVLASGVSPPGRRRPHTERPGSAGGGGSGGDQ